ncbi:MAG: carboxy-S-adenosyl-L-methionine synthase CmoA, partial [bacterium]
FVDKEAEIGGFNFGEKTAEVFDDMLGRSVPQYQEVQRMIGEVAAEFAEDGTNIYDLGCSTGITLETLMREVKNDVTFVGVDYSSAMLGRAKDRLSALPPRKHQLVEADLNQPFAVDNASVIVVNLVLQFVRPLYRDTLIRNLHSGLRDAGCLILVEKVLGNDSLFNRTFIKFYYDMKKRNGYSEMEISKKREELENVLIPYRVEENYELLRKGGFSHVDMFFKWYNFCGIVAIK